MNNLKRVLSLALSTVMLVGMMAMGASAADFTDAADIEHDDAVNILVALKVINGKPDGSFDPEGDVTRAEMAKMIAVAMNGGKDTNTGVKTTPTFTDIKDHWAESYIEYCADMGIISGRGDGTFDPGANVTGLEATKMVLTALGYDSTAYLLTGSTWAVRTDELAKKADPALYEDLDNVVMSNKASRDTAAQLIWNGLQNVTRRVSPETNTNTGEVTWSYGTSGKTMLAERYGADTVVGTYTGTYLSTGKGEKGEVEVTVTQTVNGSPRTSKYYVPSDMGIENIGEEVKVIYKEGKEGKTGPDRKDTIYGVFNTGKTEVYHVTKSDLQDTDDGKVKFDDTAYSMAVDSNNDVVGVKVWTNYVNTTTDPSPVTTANAGITADSSVDRIKFVCDNSGRIEAAYVTQVFASKVTSVTASKISINAIGTINLADHDVYDDAAKDDVVIYTKFYSGDDVFYTVTKAESVEGDLDSYKKTNKTSGNHQNVVIDGKTYKFNAEPLTIADLTSDSVTDMADTTLGDGLRLYLADGKVIAVQALDQVAKNYAMLIDTDIGTGSDNRMSSRINPARVTVLYADGTEETLALHEDSHLDVSGTDTQIIDSNKTTYVKIGNVVEYSMSGSKLKIEDVLAQSASDLADGTTAWDSTNKRVRYNDGSVNVAVAASDALLFAYVEKDNVAGATAGDDFYVYNLRDLGNIKSVTGKLVKMNADLNGKNQVKVAVATLAVRPDGASANTVYGIVNTFVGRATVGDTTYNRYIIAVEGEDMVVNATDPLNEGDVVSFEVTSDNCYAANKITNLTANGTTKTVAIDGYNESSALLTYFGATKAKAGVVNVYEGYEDITYAVKKPLSITTDKDVQVIYVNAKDKTTGSAIGVNGFDTTKGVANAIINVVHKSDDDGSYQDIVDLIVIETSGDGFPAGGFGDAVVDSDAIKVLPDGVYVIPENLDDDISAEDEANLVFFKYTAAGSTQTYTLKVSATENPNNGNLLTEVSGSYAAGGGHYFVIDITGASNMNATSGTWKGAAASAGTYYATITGDTDSNQVFSESFTVGG